MHSRGEPRRERGNQVILARPSLSKSSVWLTTHCERAGDRPFVDHHDGFGSQRQRALTKRVWGMGPDRVDQQQDPIDHRQDTLDLAAEIGARA